MLFQLLVIVKHVQTMAEPIFKHEKTSRLIILWFQNFNEIMEESSKGKEMTEQMRRPVWEGLPVSGRRAFWVT